MSTLVKQGRYVHAAEAPCGTNGLGTCVGVAHKKGGAWYIAHIDCETTVAKRNNDKWKQVAENVKKKLEQTAGSYPTGMVYCVGGFSDFTSLAIREGVQEWVKSGKATFEVKNLDGFEIDKSGLIKRLTHEENNAEGDGRFTV